jgi:uncharacterized membrane protein YtjA (UPF0391 family)
MFAPLVFLLLAIIAGVYGFTGKAVAAGGIAKILFFIFLLLFALTLSTGLLKQKARKK